jgi:DNA topoisomerase-1
MAVAPVAMVVDVPDPVVCAKTVGLRYVSDRMPGIHRERRGRGFTYHGLELCSSRQEAVNRIKLLAIPPAWTNVWICPHPNGHIQATGLDSRGRKQYIYHADWRAVRDEVKFQRMVEFGRALPEIRLAVDHGLRGPDTTRRRVVACIVRLLDKTAVRIGNREYARANESFGLTTLRPDHIDVEGSNIRLTFRAKGGKDLAISVRDRRTANVIKRLQELPGQELFQYRDDEGNVRAVDSEDVNEYLREVSAASFSAKDFRTWAASVLCAEALVALGPYDSQPAMKRNINSAVDYAAQRLGNTRTVCRSSYVHPAIIDMYIAGSLHDKWIEGYKAEGYDRLNPEEQALLAVLEHSPAGVIDFSRARKRRTRVSGSSR